MFKFEIDSYPNNYKKCFLNYPKPSIFGFFSLVHNREYRADVSQLKFLNNLNQFVNYNLNLKYDETILKPYYIDSKIDALLRFMLKEESRFSFTITNLLEDAYFFCNRGLLKIVAATPYQHDAKFTKPWRIVVTLFKGNIFLCRRDTEKDVEKSLKPSKMDWLFTSWGYKFEHFVLSDSPTTKPTPNEPLNQFEEFNIVLHGRINNHNMIFGAETDGIVSDEHTTAPPDPELGMDAVKQYLSTKRFVELKTNVLLANEQHTLQFKRHKLLNHYLQCKIAGVDCLVCGFRDGQGVVKQLQSFTLEEMEDQANGWQPNVCLSFLDTFLTFVKECLSKEIVSRYGRSYLRNIQNIPLTSLHFEWSPNMPVRLTSNYNQETDPVLPDWFKSKYGATL